VRVERLVSCRGGIQVARQRVQVGLPLACEVLVVEVEDTLRISNESKTILKTVPG
jgi:hypothetical protein